MLKRAELLGGARGSQSACSQSGCDLLMTVFFFFSVETVQATSLGSAEVQDNSVVNFKSTGDTEMSHFG